MSTSLNPFFQGFCISIDTARYIYLAVEVIHMRRRPGRKSWKELSPPLIKAYLSEREDQVFTENSLRKIINTNRREWLIPTSLSNAKIISFLLEKTQLQAVQLSSKAYESQSGIRYCWGDVSPFALANSLRPNSYLCYSTAAYLLGLLDEIPQTFYLNKEQSPKPRPTGGLQQAAIDRAFANRQRQSAMALKWDKYQVIVVNGKSTGNLGSITVKDPSGGFVQCSNLERTLIDMAVRPAYSGGIHKVLEAYEKALPDVSATRLAAFLKKLDYVYPYHQNIGFFMQKAGFSVKSYERFSGLGLNYDFHLDYGMKKTEFVPEWRLHVPEGFGLTS